MIGKKDIVWIIAFAVAALLYVGNAVRSLDRNQFAYDFQLRYNEARCVLAGTDPYFVWNGKERLPPYVSYRNAGPLVDGRHDYVHAYPPWEYAFMLPFALMPKDVATAVWFVFELICALLLICGAVLIGYRLRGEIREGAFCGICAVAASYYCVYCLNYLNFGVIIAVLISAMAIALNRRRDALAGICWALMMVKPQLAMLFAVPMFVERRWRAVFTAVAVCTAAGLVPAVICGRNPVSMILSISDYGAGMFPKCFLLGDSAAAWLADCAPGMPMAVNMVIGVTACVILSLRFRRTDDWMLKLMPVTLLSIMWSVSRYYDWSVLSVVFLGVGLTILRQPLRTDVLPWVVGTLVAAFLPPAVNFGLIPMLALIALVLVVGLMALPWKNVVRMALALSALILSFFVVAVPVEPETVFAVFLTLAVLGTASAKSYYWMLAAALVVVLSGLASFESSPVAVYFIGVTFFLFAGLPGIGSETASVNTRE